MDQIYGVLKASVQASKFEKLLKISFEAWNRRGHDGGGPKNSMAIKSIGKTS